MSYSLKFTLKSIWRDITIGFRARHLVYPKLARNEYSAKDLSQYIERQTSRLGIPRPPNIKALDTITNNHDCIDKNSLLNNPKKFIKPRSITTLLRNKISTSGSTGRPLTLIQDIGTAIREEAFVYRQLRWAGYTWGDRRAWIRGDIVCSNTPSNGLYGCRDWWSNTILLSSYHISSSTIKNYIDTLTKFNPVLIQAYPSSISTIASWMLANDIKYTGHSLQAIVTSSETLDPAMQARVEAAFGCRVFDWYGQAERVTAIGTCEQGNHHALTDYGGIELLPDADDFYELVGTSYNNQAMRLVRYKTGDLVKHTKEDCPCGRQFPVVDHITGRRDKTIILSDGRHISRLGHIFKDAINLIEGQIIYRGNNHILLRVVPGPKWTTADSEILKTRLKDRVSNITVEIETVTTIDRGANGKFEFIRIEDCT